MCGHRRTVPGPLLPVVLLALVWIGTASGGTIGSDGCAMCHEDVVASFQHNPHWRSDPEGSCEGCHGEGEAHADEADPARIRGLGEESPASEVSEACLTCHADSRSHRGWSGSDHARAGESCTSCHAVHSSVAGTVLLKSKTPGLCHDCHASVRAQFDLPERHPVDGVAMDCIDCHDPHSASDHAVLGGFRQRTCLRCHGEYRGPWFFEHEAVTVEGCPSCHAPHGSVNRHLLTYQRVGDLCLQCHPVQPFFHTAVDDSGERTTGINDCTRCHSEIHGSNNDALFLN